MTTRRWFTIFFAMLAATALLLLGALFHTLGVVRQAGYPDSTGDPAVRLQDLPFTWRDQHCDILIAGDSTAAVGIDPALVAAQTRLTACSVATNRPNVDDLGTLPVDSFLKHNFKPRLIVFQFGPEDFYRAKSPWQHAGPYTPILMLARDADAHFALHTMLMHPAETTQFVLYILQNEIMPRKLSPEARAHYQRALDHAVKSNGQLDLELPAETHCRAPALTLYGPLDSDWTRRLHQRYESQGIHVLVRAAPVPECDPQLALFTRQLGPAVDGNVNPLPITDFVAGDRHTTLAGSQADTLGLVALIRAREAALLH